MGKSNAKYVYGLNGVKLESVGLIKDLGVFIDPSLTFTQHIAAVCAKARSRCAMFFKFFISRDPFTMKTFFTSYVRPILEFSSPVWNPIAQSNINIIENVQRYFTNKIPTCTFLPYKRRLQLLNLDSLQKRRLVADLVFVFSAMTGISNTALYPYFNLINPSVTRSHNLRIVPPILNFKSSQQNIVSRTCPIWNILPDS